MKTSIRTLVASALAVAVASAAGSVRAETIHPAQPSEAPLAKHGCMGASAEGGNGMMMGKDGAAPAQADAQEKCYGVVRAGKNDCAAADGKHDCAGAGTQDAAPGEWVNVPAGLCDRLVGGSKEPKAN